jgi:subtilisin family serine protease
MNHTIKHLNIGKIKLMVLGILIPAVMVFIAIALFFPARAKSETADRARTHIDLGLSFPEVRSAEVSTIPGMESVLNRLVSVYTGEGETAAAEFAARRGIPLKNNRVQVVLSVMAPLTSPGQVGADEVAKTTGAGRIDLQKAVTQVRTRLEGLGGRIERVQHSLVRCNIDIKSLKQLAETPMIRSVRLPNRLRPTVISEGVFLSSALSYQDLPPYRSAGAKVCILDVGFKSYRDLLGSELPESVTAKSFLEEDDIEADQVHGTACAEIVHDMAPDAELFLANILYDTDLADAVDWIIQQNIDVISYSLGSYWGAGDGTGFENYLAEIARDSGTVWVSSAGNEAHTHWSGTFNDPDNDGWHNFADGDEILEFYVPAGLAEEWGVEAYLKWYDWGTWNEVSGYSGTSEDYDLWLFYWNGSEWQAADASENRQPGFKWPWEGLSGWKTMLDRYWGVAIRKIQGTKNVRFDLFIPTHEYGTLEYNVPEGSITNPSDSPNVVAVGAVDSASLEYHYYSSRGPTKDGRLKPDLSAASRVSVSDTTYGSITTPGDGFAGTSASCPHVAGAIALLKSKTPFTVEEILQILFARAVDLGDPGPDYLYGFGFLNLFPLNATN